MSLTSSGNKGGGAELEKFILVLSWVDSAIVKWPTFYRNVA